MSDPPAAITNPETSKTASQSRPSSAAAHLVDVGAVGDQPFDLRPAGPSASAHG